MPNAEYTSTTLACWGKIWLWGLRFRWWFKINYFLNDKAASPKSTFPTFIDAGYESLDPDNLRNILLTIFVSDIVLNILQQGLIKWNKKNSTHISDMVFIYLISVTQPNRYLLPILANRYQPISNNTCIGIITDMKFIPNISVNKLNR